jgi:hypothetical protein
MPSILSRPLRRHLKSAGKAHLIIIVTLMDDKSPQTRALDARSGPLTRSLLSALGPIFSLSSLKGAALSRLAPEMRSSTQILVRRLFIWHSGPAI